MATKLIKLADDTLIEVETPERKAQAISGGVADQVEGTIDKIRPLLLKVCKPLTSVWNEVNKDMKLEQAEIQIGLNFEAEGNVFLAKSKANANINVTIVVKPNQTK